MYKLLLVDDDDDHLSLFIRQLKKVDDSLIIETALDAEGAMVLLAQYRWKLDAIISDLNMPHQTGFELAAAVRSLGFETPFFILTADQKVGEKEAEKFGVTGVFYKPASPAKLLSAIKKAKIVRKTPTRKKKTQLK